MSNPNIELALVEELRDYIRREKIMSDAAEILSYYVAWLFRFCEKNGIEIPDRERLYQANVKLNGLLEEFYKESGVREYAPRAIPKRNTKLITPNEATRPVTPPTKQNQNLTSLSLYLNQKP